MRSLTQGRCFQRQIHTTSDMELQNETNDPGNVNENGGALIAVETAEPNLLNRTHDSSTLSGKPVVGEFLEIFLSFYYYIGVSPFRIDLNRNLRSSCINKMLSILITLVAIIYIIFNVRTLAWMIDEADISQQIKASSYIGLVYNFCAFVLNACLFRMIWCKQEAFLKLFRFQDISNISTGLNSSLLNFLVISICSLTIFIPLISTVGGLSILDSLQKWSFFEILSHQEVNLLLGLKKSWDSTDSNNDTSRMGTNSTKDDDNGGIFLSDADLETTIFGSVGMAVEFCQQIFSLFSHDCFLLSTVTLWISTKQLRDQFEVWEIRVKESNLGSSRNIADDIVKEHKKLSLLSKHINTITNSFLPALLMANIITMSYFMYNLVTRQWYFALSLSLKLYKTWLAIYFAIKISKVAEGYYSWFISDEVREILDLSCKNLHHILEMKERPVGIGSGVFYIDTKFILSSLGIISTYFYMVTGTGA